MFPVDKNAILLRVENIGDHFDDDFKIVSPYSFNIHDLALLLYEDANADVSHLTSINVEEQSLTGNQHYNNMKIAKIHWQTVDDVKDQ